MNIKHIITVLLALTLLEVIALFFVIQKVYTQGIQAITIPDVGLLILPIIAMLGIAPVLSRKPETPLLKKRQFTSQSEIQYKQYSQEIPPQQASHIPLIHQVTSKPTTTVIESSRTQGLISTTSSKEEPYARISSSEVKVPVTTHHVETQNYPIEVRVIDETEKEKEQGISNVYSIIKLLLELPPLERMLLFHIVQNNGIIKIHEIISTYNVTREEVKKALESLQQRGLIRIQTS